MKKLTFALILIAFSANDLIAEITNWWGLVSFRERYEITEEYYADPSQTNYGDLRQKDTNSKVRIGYQFGFIMDYSETVSAGITLRSGLGSVMWQDVDNENSGLNPGLQEAYIDWSPPFANLLLGRVPQNSTALWDLYAAHNYLRDPIRQDNPTDGVFNDKIGYLNGGKISVPVGPVTLRGTFHTDYVKGYLREYDQSTSPSSRDNGLDQYVWLGGLSVDIMYIVLGLSGKDNKYGVMLDLDADLGLPYRIGSEFRSVDTDSVYADEDLWGLTVNTGVDWAKLTWGYAYNWRDSVHTSRYWDYKLAVNPSGVSSLVSLPDMAQNALNFTLTTRYQLSDQQHEFGLYTGRNAVISAFHIYANKELWGLDIQPRYIKFETEVSDATADVVTRTITRYEITTTVRF